MFHRTSLWLILFLTLLDPAQLSAQAPSYPRNYFRWPLNNTPDIVANLGELRNNHWHMGLDVRTDQRENLQVVAAAEGYISKIRIERQGFGRCIWITHPNGFTTLYAHLNDFFPALEEYVTRQQYQQQTWAIELSFTRDQFPVTKGQFIAYSGNTGGSQGPHLHFEIRDTKTDECLNPLLFGVPIQDNVPPSLFRLALYDRNKSVYNQTPQLFALKKTGDGYVIPKSPVVVTSHDRISFGLQAVDKRNGTANEDGIYSADLYVDGVFQCGFRLDSISYEETGYLNAHIDYRYRFNGGPFLQNIFRLPGDHGHVYHSNGSDGVIQLGDTLAHAVEIVVKDARQNTSVLRFSVQRSDNSADDQPRVLKTAPFNPNMANAVRQPTFEALLPQNCLYDTVYPFYYRENQLPAGALSARYQLNEPSVPVHGDMTIHIMPERAVDPSVRNRVVIRRSFRSGGETRKVDWEGEWMTARFGDFGYFQAFADTEEPEVNAPGKGDTIDLSPQSRIVFTPTDNFGVRSLRAELDGNWLRFTNDKGRNYIYNFDERCPYGVHKLKVTVEDIAGNSITRTWWFKRYPYTPPVKKVKKAPRKKSTVQKKGTSRKKR